MFKQSLDPVTLRKRKREMAGEMVQGLEALAALVGDLSLIPSMLMTAYSL